MKIVIDIPEGLFEAYKGRPPRLGDEGMDMIAQAIANGTPYEDRPQGEWIVGEYMDCHSDILPKYTCPFCGKVEYGKYDFCHCGADMRGEK